MGVLMALHCGLPGYPLPSLSARMMIVMWWGLEWLFSNQEIFVEGGRDFKIFLDQNTNFQPEASLKRSMSKLKDKIQRCLKFYLCIQHRSNSTFGSELIFITLESGCTPIWLSFDFTSVLFVIKVNPFHFWSMSIVFSNQRRSRTCICILRLLRWNWKRNF